MAKIPPVAIRSLAYHASMIFFFCGSAAADSKQISFTAGSDNNDQHLFARSSLERLPPVELLMGT